LISKKLLYLSIGTATFTSTILAELLNYIDLTIPT